MQHEEHTIEHMVVKINRAGPRPEYTNSAVGMDQVCNRGLGGLSQHFYVANIVLREMQSDKRRCHTNLSWLAWLLCSLGAKLQSAYHSVLEAGECFA